jgi:integrase
VLDITAAGPTVRGIPFGCRSSSTAAGSPGRERAVTAGLTKCPRVHELRHNYASWMIRAGVPLPVIQQHLGHESIQTTIRFAGT